MRKRALEWNDWDSLAAREWASMGYKGRLIRRAFESASEWT